MTSKNPRRPSPCFVCGVALESVFAGIDECLEQPADAVTFHSYGQYGSTAFDPQDDSQIQINICDSCLLKRSGRVWHVRYVARRPQEIFSRPWDPEGEPAEDRCGDCGLAGEHSDELCAARVAMLRKAIDESNAELRAIGIDPPDVHHAAESANQEGGPHDLGD